MTDLEITRLCAESVGIVPIAPASVDGSMWYYGKPNDMNPYDPLHDDEQAMALVKRFNIGSKFYEDESAWGAFIETERGEIACYCYKDLNRAICECVAKMQAAK